MKVDTKEIVTKLREAGVDEKLIPALVMTAYYESNLNSLAVNTNTNKSKDYGLFQINSASFYKEDGSPDETLESYFEKENMASLSKGAFERKLKDLDFNISFTAHYVDRIANNPKSFGTEDPLDLWNAYKTYVKPFLAGDKIPPRGNNDEAKRRDVINGIGTYTDAFLQLSGLALQEEVANINPVAVTKTVQQNVARSQQEEEVKDVLTAHIYSYLQKQKEIYRSQVPQQAGSIEGARIKTDIRREERDGGR
jgi:hypothetical protein|tara:strand:- start:496 stop:1251 length:756 start_codon:yes stop_codon:yes gene_type:complete